MPQRCSKIDLLWQLAHIEKHAKRDLYQGSLAKAPDIGAQRLQAIVRQCTLHESPIEFDFLLVGRRVVVLQSRGIEITLGNAEGALET